MRLNRAKFGGLQLPAQDWSPETFYSVCVDIKGLLVTDQDAENHAESAGIPTFFHGTKNAVFSVRLYLGWFEGRAVWPKPGESSDFLV